MTHSPFETPLAAPKPTGVRYLILGLACSVSFVLYLHRYAWAFIKKDVQEEFGWDTVALGWMDSCFDITYGLGQIPSGILCDWFGAHLLLGSIVCLWSLSLLCIVWATGFTSMALSRLTFGAAQAGCYPTLNKVSKNWFPISMRTTAQAWIATFFGRGGAAMSFILFGTVLIGWLEMPWRSALVVLTGIGLVAGIVFIFLFRNTPAEHPWANHAEAELIVSGDAVAAHATRSRLNWSKALRHRNLQLLFLRSFAGNMTDAFFVYWVPLFLLSEKGVDIKSAGWMSALPLVGGACGGVFSGFLQSRLLRRLKNRRWARSSLGFCGKTLAGLCMWGSLSFDNAASVMCVFMLVKFFNDWSQVAVWGTMSDIGGRNAATVFASANTVGSIAKSIAGPFYGFVLLYFSGGPIPTTAGWNALFTIMIVEYLIDATAWLFIDCTKPIDPDDDVAEDTLENLG